MSSRFHALLPLTALALALTACGDATGPGDPLQVTLAATVEGTPTVQRSDDGTPYLRCIVRLSAQATGKGRASWGDTTLRWYAGGTRTAPFDSVVVPMGDLTGAWEEGFDIGAGDTRTSHWTVGATVPFDIEFAVRYRPGNGAVRTASVPLRCGPPIPADAAPPEVTSLAAVQRDDLLEPGDTLDVTFTATSAATLWRSVVYLTGACELAIDNVETLGTAVTRTVRVPIPRDCRQGVPLWVGVSVLDGAARSVTQVLPSPLGLSDGTPPTFDPTFSSPAGGAAPAPRGTYFVGQAVDVWPNHWDNVGVAWLVWELLPSGARDSLPLVGMDPFQLPVRESWLGATQLRLRVRDTGGLESATRTVSLDGVRVLPTLTPTIRTVQVSGEVRAVVPDPKRDVAYLLQSSQHRIAVLSLASMTIVRTIATPEYPGGLDITAGGDSLLFTQLFSRSIGVVDLRAATPTVTTIPLPTLDSTLNQGPSAVYAMASGMAFVRTEGSSAAAMQLVELNLATGAVRVRTDAAMGGFDSRMARSLGHRVFLLKGGGERLQRYSTASDAFTLGSPVPTDVQLLATVDESGATAAFGRQLYDASATFTRTAQWPGSIALWAGEPASTLSADGASLHIPVGTSFVQARTSDGLLASRIILPVAPGYSVAWPGTGRMIAVKSVLDGTSTVMVIE